MQNTLTLNLPISIRYHLTLNLKFFWILSLLTLISLLIFYIFQANSIVSERYQIQNYQMKLNGLSQENETLEINSAQVNSLENIENKIKELGFEKVGQIHYIRVLESQIVTK